MKTDSLPSKDTSIYLYVGGFILAVGGVFISLLMFLSQANSVHLIKKELLQLETDRKTALVASDILKEYSSEKDVLASVFPNEKSISDFISVLESVLKEFSPDYSLKFNSLIPIPESDKLYILMTIIMKTDLGKMKLFLTRLETLPYMTHVTSIGVKTPQGISAQSEIQVGLKVYVQNPFTSK